MRFGIEIEQFLLDKDGSPMVVPTSLPADSEGVQVEARGLPHNDIVQAVYSAIGEMEGIERRAQEMGLMLAKGVSVLKIPRDVKLKARMVYSKGILSYRNLYNYTRHRVSVHESTAGVHLSVTNPYTIMWKDGQYQETFRMWDFPSFFRHLDGVFKEEIRAAKRNPGFYELKPDGRVEYRSLPNNIDWWKLIEVVREYKHF